MLHDFWQKRNTQKRKKNIPENLSGIHNDSAYKAHHLLVFLSDRSSFKFTHSFSSAKCTGHTEILAIVEGDRMLMALQRELHVKLAIRFLNYNPYIFICPSTNHQFYEQTNHWNVSKAFSGVRIIPPPENCSKRKEAMLESQHTRKEKKNEMLYKLAIPRNPVQLVRGSKLTKASNPAIHGTKVNVIGRK